MTKEDVMQKIKDILTKDKSFNGAKIKISFSDKKINSITKEIFQKRL